MSLSLLTDIVLALIIFFIYSRARLPGTDWDRKPGHATAPVFLGLFWILDRTVMPAMMEASIENGVATIVSVFAQPLGLSALSTMLFLTRLGLATVAVMGATRLTRGYSRVRVSSAAGISMVYLSLAAGVQACL